MKKLYHDLVMEDKRQSIERRENPLLKTSAELLMPPGFSRQAFWLHPVRFFASTPRSNDTERIVCG